MEISVWLAISALFISICGIVVNALLVIHVGKSIQSGLANNRALKDYLFVEVQALRHNYDTYLNSLFVSNLEGKDIIAWFKLTTAKVNDLMLLIHNEYDIDFYTFQPFTSNLLIIIAGSKEFERDFSASKINFSDQTREDVINFQQNNDKLFNEVIMAINKVKTKV